MRLDDDATQIGRPVPTAPVNTPPGSLAAVMGGRLAALGLVLVATIGGVLSYTSVRAAAVPMFGPVLASLYPVMVDAGIGAASLYYLHTVRAGRPVPGYRLLTHVLVVATIALNAATASTPRELLFHLVPPALFSTLVELRARQALGEFQAFAGSRGDRIPLRLWLTAPAPTLREWLWAARAGIRFHTGARSAHGQYLAACEVLRLSVPGREGRRARAVLRRQLRSGALSPRTLIETMGLPTGERTGPQAALRSALLAVLEGQTAAIVEPRPAGPPDSPALSFVGHINEQPAMITAVTSSATPDLTGPVTSDQAADQPVDQPVDQPGVRTGQAGQGTGHPVTVPRPRREHPSPRTRPATTGEAPAGRPNSTASRDAVHRNVKRPGAANVERFEDHQRGSGQRDLAADLLAAARRLGTEPAQLLNLPAAALLRVRFPDENADVYQLAEHLLDGRSYTNTEAATLLEVSVSTGGRRLRRAREVIAQLSPPPQPTSVSATVRTLNPAGPTGDATDCLVGRASSW
jgi:hypothetical protein